MSVAYAEICFNVIHIYENTLISVRSSCSPEDRTMWQLMLIYLNV